MLKIKIDYPSQEEELKILNTMASTKPDYTINSVVSPQEILRSRKLIDSIYIDNKIKDYIIDIVFTTRDPMRFKLNLANMIQFGASPRATIALTLASKAWAFFHGRAFVTPQDVKNIAMDVLRHRVIISYEAEAEGLTSENIVQKILDTVPVP